MTQISLSIEKTTSIQAEMAGVVELLYMTTLQKGLICEKISLLENRVNDWLMNCTESMRRSTSA